jgi:hypothetical protein
MRAWALHSVCSVIIEQVRWCLCEVCGLISVGNTLGKMLRQYLNHEYSCGICRPAVVGPSLVSQKVGVEPLVAVTPIRLNLTLQQSSGGQYGP